MEIREMMILTSMREIIENFEKYAAGVIIKAIKGGNKILIIGNGGSAGESTHWVGEFLGKFEKKGKPLPAISLFDLSTITAIANDYSYDDIFSRQIEALGKPGDVLITLSTSGKSKNILKAIEVSDKLGVKVITMPTNKDFHSSTAQTQETHLKMIHQIMRLVEKECR